MIDFARLEKLYALANSGEDTPERARAREVISEIQDGVLAEYLALPENRWKWDGPRKGKPQYANYDDLASSVTGWLWRGPGEWDSYRKRAEELKADRLGILLRHRQLERARKLHQSDWQFATILGDRYMLGLEPARMPGEIAPQYTEFTLPDE